MTYDEVESVARTLLTGERARFTWINGYQRVGKVGTMDLGRSEPILTLDGNMMGGEFGNVCRIEIMRPNGRYSTIAG